MAKPKKLLHGLKLQVNLELLNQEFNLQITSLLCEPV